MNVSVRRGALAPVVAAAAFGLLVLLELRVAGTPSPDTEDPPPPVAVVLAAVPAAFGVRLADGAGRTLYTFSGDGWNDSNCSGRCAEVWPPARSAGASRGPGPGSWRRWSAACCARTAATS